MLPKQVLRSSLKHKKQHWAGDMLKVIDDGVIITLTGNNKSPLLLWSSILVVLAIGVAVVAITTSTRTTIGVMFVFAVLVFIFNIYKNKLSNHGFISTGQLTIKNHHFISSSHSVKLSDDATITLTQQKLIIRDLGRVWHISGFEQDKELHITKSILEGKALEKRERAIRLL